MLQSQFQCNAKQWRILDGVLNILSTDSEVKDWAHAKAKAFEKNTRELLNSESLQGVEELAAIRCAVADLESLGVDVPESFAEFIERGQFEDQPHRLRAASDFKRLFSSRWWTRQARVIQARALETEARRQGYTNLKRGRYVSDFTVRRRLQQKQRNRELLECLEAVNESGQAYTLAELAALGVANPALRRMELMARIGGFERLAARTELFVPMFYTVTCPSKYHSHHHTGAMNEKWNGTTPRQAQEYLQSVWARVRAAWDKAGIRAFGFRCVEPHHDGCPHWHLILWFRPGQQDKATLIFRHYALLEDGNEPGAQERRFTPVKIDTSKGTAAGYVVKYVSKNIDGHGVECDSYGRDAVESAMRIEAWASTWGIRQFQQIGGPSVTVWRELRRARDEYLLDDEEFKRIQDAANNGDWSAFTELMGGPDVARSEMPIRAHMVCRVTRNDYNEIVMQIVGVVYQGDVAITRNHTWTITFKRAVPIDTDAKRVRAPPRAA